MSKGPEARINQDTLTISIINGYAARSILKGQGFHFNDNASVPPSTFDLKDAAQFGMRVLISTKAPAWEKSFSSREELIEARNELSSCGVDVSGAKFLKPELISALREHGLLVDSL